MAAKEQLGVSLAFLIQVSLSLQAAEYRRSQAPKFSHARIYRLQGRNGANMKFMLANTLSILLIIGFASSSHGEELPHREDLAMNSISGSEFRRYVMEHLEGHGNWAQAMRSLGVFHNLMHEMMSDFARYGRSMNAESVPEFDLRISGGQWSEYRARLESKEEPSSWQDFVQITEIMHDRVHQVMYKTVVLDARVRNVDIAEFAGSDRAPHASEDTFPENGAPGLEMISADDFRRLAWIADIEDANLNSAVQQFAAFGEMLDDLLTLWAFHGALLDDPACRLDNAGDRMTGQRWQAQVDGLGDCGDENWVNLARAISLMHDRVRHAMFKLSAYL